MPLADAAAVADATSHGPWLRERLPADTIAYVRVPSLWGALAAPSGGPGDAMRANQATVDAIAALRRAFVSDAEILALGAGQVRLIEALASPIELAVVAPNKSAGPAAGGFLSVRLVAADAAAAASLVSEAADGALGDLSFDAAGNASVEFGGNPVYFHYSAPEQRLFALGGLFASAQQLESLVADAGKAQDTHPMRALERRIDEGGQGVVLWVDAEALRPLLMTGLSADQAWLRPALNSAKAFALGWGTAQGNGSLALRMQLEDAPWGPMLPAGPHRFDAMAVGEPAWVVTAALPTLAQIEAAFEWVQSAQDAGGPAALSDLDAELEKATGLKLADWLKPWGGPFVAVEDASGQWQAFQLADPAALDRVVETVSSRLGGSHATHIHAGITLHHLQLPSTSDLMKQFDAAAMPPADSSAERWLALYGRLKSHVYFYQADGWLYVASVPQPLMERIDRKAATDVGDWLQRTQRSGREHALISASSQFRDVSKTIYAFQLEVLKLLGDLSGAEIDLFALPTAQQLALPESTPIGIELNLDANQFALQLNYGYTPLEGMGAAGGVGSIAVVGILAAVALPAYQDYTQRAKVMSAITAASGLKVAISEHYFSAGRLPEQGDEIGLALPLQYEQAYLTLEGGAIRIEFDEDAEGLVGEHLYLVPGRLSDGRLEWACAYAAAKPGFDAMVAPANGEDVSSLPVKLLPTACR